MDEELLVLKAMAMKSDKVLLTAFIVFIMLAAVLAFAIVSSNGPREYVIIPEGAGHYAASEYPRIIDNGNGTVNLIIYPESRYGNRFAVEFDNEPLIREGVATTNGPTLINDISIMDWAHDLLVDITPLPDGSGNVSISASTIAGTYIEKGKIQKPLAIKPYNDTLGYTATLNNDSLEIFHGCTLKLATIHEGGETYYVVAGVEINESAERFA